MNKPSQSNRNGSALVLVMAVLVIMLVIGVGLLSLGQNSRMQAVRASSDVSARSAADAGLTKGLFEMNKKLNVKPWSDSNLPYVVNETLPNCNATFSYRATTNAKNVYNIESIGNSGQVQKTVDSSLKLKGLFEYAIFTNGTLTFMNGITVDMYNAGAADPALQIGTNSTLAGAITAKTGVTINGDVVVGVGGNPNTIINSKLEATITGNTYPAIEQYKMSSITAPAWLQALPSKGTLSGSSTITTSAKYDSINLNSSQIVTNNGPVTLYVTGNITLDNSAQIQIVDKTTNPDASLTIYLGGNLVSQNGGIINNLAKDTQKLKIYGLDTCQSFNFKAGSIFYGAIYAPKANVQLNAWVEYYGACVANSFTQNVKANFHYDASLRNASVSDAGVCFIIKQWHEE